MMRIVSIWDGRNEILDVGLKYATEIIKDTVKN